MGTRSLTRVIPRQKGLSYDDGHNHVEKSVVNMYKQYDGYPEGLGLKLAEFLGEIQIINGLPVGYRCDLANGPGCLAAQLVQHFKDGPGGIYLKGTNGKPGDYCEDYIYTIYPKEDEPTYISIYSTYEGKCIFVGTPDKLQTKYEK